MCPLPEKTAKYPATGTGFHFPLFQPDREHPPEKPPRDDRSASATPRNRQIAGKTVQKRHKPVPTACPDGFFSGQGIHPVKKTGQLQTTSWMDTVCTENGTEIAKNLFPLRDPSKQLVRPGFLQPSIKTRYLQPPFSVTVRQHRQTAETKNASGKSIEKSGCNTRFLYCR